MRRKLPVLRMTYLCLTVLPPPDLDTVPLDEGERPPPTLVALGEAGYKKKMDIQGA